MKRILLGLLTGGLALTGQALPTLSLTSQPFGGATYVTAYGQTQGQDPAVNLTCYAYGPVNGQIQTSCYANVNGGFAAVFVGNLTNKDSFYTLQPYGNPAYPSYLVVQAYPQAGHMCFVVSGGAAQPISKCGLF